MISDPKSEIEKNLIRVSPILYLRSSTLKPFEFMK